MTAGKERRRYLNQQVNCVIILLAHDSLHTKNSGLGTPKDARGFNHELTAQNYLSRIEMASDSFFECTVGKQTTDSRNV